MIFENQTRAAACELALAEQCGALRQMPYPCRHGEHWHLTKWRRGGPS